MYNIPFKNYRSAYFKNYIKLLSCGNVYCAVPFSCSVSPLSGNGTFLLTPLIVESELEEGDFFLSLKSRVNFGNNSLRLVIKTMYSIVTTPSSSSIVSLSDTTKLMSYSLFSRRMSNVFVSEFRSCVRTRSVPSNT